MRLFVRIVDHIGAGWSPPRLSQDPVQWWRRSHNKVADGLADLTMDQRRTWTKRFFTSIHITCANMIIQTDGGRRDGDCAAAAWTIGHWGEADGEPTFEPLVAHGTLLDDTCTVFGAEAIALDEASREVDALLKSAPL